MNLATNHKGTYIYFVVKCFHKVTKKNTLMNFYKLLALLFLTWSISSYTTEDLTSDIQQSDIIGHWDITVPTGMMFTEFSPDNRVLTGDRGTIAGQNASNHYFQYYALENGNEVIDFSYRS